MDCPKCNANVENNATFCNSCGYKLSGDGQILSTNAVASIQDKSTKLFKRVTYSTLTEFLFYSTLVAMVGGIVSMFSLIEGSFVYAIPAILMSVTIVYRTVVMFVDVDSLTNEQLAQELRCLLTFFSYSLFLMVFAVIVIGVAMIAGSWKAGSVIAIFWGLISAYGGIASFSISIIVVIFLATSVRK
jgi:hypothetical protein